MPNPDASGNRQALGVLVGADGTVDELVGHGICQLLAMIVGDQLEHEVD
jgi:hypothetical protein